MGFSLLSVPGKVLTRVILNRIGKIIDEKLRDNQCGFRPGRGCNDQIFTLRQLIEKNESLGKISTLASLIFLKPMIQYGVRGCRSYSGNMEWNPR